VTPPTTVKDEAGVEYLLECRVGDVVKVEPSENEKNFKVHVKVDEGNLKYPAQGWLEATDPLLEIARRAMAEGRKVAARIETRRDRKVDPATPIKEVDKKFKRLTQLVIKGEPGFDAVTAVAERDAAAGVNGAPAQIPASEARPVANAPSRQHAEADREEWAFAAAVGMVDLAFETLTDWKTGQPGRQFMPGDIEHLATVLLAAADAAQMAQGGQVDRAARSHTRARGAVRTAIAAYPPPIDDTDVPPPAWADVWGPWEKQITRTASTLMAIARKLTYGPVEDRPVDREVQRAAEFAANAQRAKASRPPEDSLPDNPEFDVDPPDEDPFGDDEFNPPQPIPASAAKEFAELVRSLPEPQRKDFAQWRNTNNIPSVTKTWTLKQLDMATAAINRLGAPAVAQPAPAGEPAVPVVQAARLTPAAVANLDYRGLVEALNQRELPTNGVMDALRARLLEALSAGVAG
jgi:hypothetical protein